jgi:NAD(P)-dependent dehydrogenase (short-subunit alcohol dehydrogenase family)
MARVALVTGGTRGIGAAISVELKRAGYKVAANYGGNDEAAQKFKAETGIPVYKWDVGNAAACAAGLKDVEAALGPIDILVNNSGVSATKRITDTTEADYDFVMDTNARGAFFVAQAVGKRMIARGQGGRIVNIASLAGIRVLGQLSVYCMSKAAAIQMTRAMALEWSRFNINVNAICPGYIETEINRDHFRSEAGRKLVDMLPRKRIGKPEDLDGLLLLLASEQSGFINGSIITADDGLSVT